MSKDKEDLDKMLNRIAWALRGIEGRKAFERIEQRREGAKKVECPPPPSAELWELRAKSAMMNEEKTKIALEIGERELLHLLRREGSVSIKVKDTEIVLTPSGTIQYCDMEE